MEKNGEREFERMWLDIKSTRIRERFKSAQVFNLTYSQSANGQIHKSRYPVYPHAEFWGSGGAARMCHEEFALIVGIIVIVILMTLYEWPKMNKNQKKEKREFGFHIQM